MESRWETSNSIIIFLMVQKFAEMGKNKKSKKQGENRREGWRDKECFFVVVEREPKGARGEKKKKDERRRLIILQVGKLEVKIEKGKVKEEEEEAGGKEMI